jgi:putative hemolysin
MYSMRDIAIIVAALVLAACHSEPKAVTETSGSTTTSGSVTYKYEGDQIKDASAKAATYCSKMGRQAELRNTSRQGDDNLATFDCR